MTWQHSCCIWLQVKTGTEWVTCAKISANRAAGSAIEAGTNTRGVGRPVIRLRTANHSQSVTVRATMR